MEIPRPYHQARQLFLTYTLVCSSSPVLEAKNIHVTNYHQISLFTILHRNLTADVSLDQMILLLQ
jgi:hypothetical protein